MRDYQKFIENKHFRPVEAGFDYQYAGSILRDYQAAVTEWALRRGRAAAFLDTGLGKTGIELEFARAASEETGKPSLILAPLCVSQQIQREAGENFDTEARISRDMGSVMPGVNICNYEQAHKLDPNAFGAVVLDESSILKGMNGKMRRFLTEHFSGVPYRLSASATPAPNDFMELGTQSEFLGIMTQTEMLATFFIHDGSDTSKWRLKGHGRAKFFEWLATWAVIMRDPSDYGFDPLPPLPALDIEQVSVESGIMDGLLPAVAQGMTDRLKVRRETVDSRCRAAADIANSLDGPVLLWCNLNAEGDLLECLVDGAAQVSGADDDDDKTERLMGFASGDLGRLITKPKIAGHGMNWQHCNQMIFVGLSDSWEQYYQAMRRCWRQGQSRDVKVWVITADAEGAVVDNIRRKQKDADMLMDQMAKIAHQSFSGFDKAGRELAHYGANKQAPRPKF